MPLRSIGGPGRSEITNILTRDSLWDDIFYLNHMFQHINGCESNVLGTSWVVVGACVLEIHTGVNINSQVHSRLSIDPLGIFSFDKARRFRTFVVLGDNTTQEFYILTGRKADALQDGGLYPYFGFKITNNQIFGCVGNATGETVTAQLATFAAGDHLLLEARFIPNVECRFYINGVDVGTLTVGLPTGASQAYNLMYVWAENTVADDRNIGVHFWEFYQAR